MRQYVKDTLDVNERLGGVGGEDYLKMKRLYDHEFKHKINFEVMEEEVQLHRTGFYKDYDKKSKAEKEKLARVRRQVLNKSEARYGKRDREKLEAVYQRDWTTRTKWNLDLSIHNPNREADLKEREEIDHRITEEAKALYGEDMKNRRKCREYYYNNFPMSSWEEEVHEHENEEDPSTTGTSPGSPTYGVGEGKGQGGEESYVERDEIDVSSLWSVRPDLKNSYL